MRPENHTASSFPDYTPDELDFLVQIYEHAREKPQRRMTYVDVYRFVKSKGLLKSTDEDDDSGYEMPVRSMQRPEVCVDLAGFDEEDLD